MAKSLHGFTLLKTQQIPELHTKASLYEHVRTRAQLLSLENEDENKSFGITFRTPPPDATGIAHILEHSVLCGSKKYPLKEPFIELVKGSLNTFLNAFTYPDKTSYPVASTNEKDFYNLVGVYLDAVFFPKLTRETLMQEGWHLHQEKPSDPVEFKGVVFNEMKGAYNSPDRALFDTIQVALLPDTPYRHDSGGDPLKIPDLRYEDFVAFHKRFYHPSNALLFFSGNDSIEKRFVLADEYLSQFEYQDVQSDIPLQPAFTHPTLVHAPLAISKEDDPKKKGMVTVNWVLAESIHTDIALRLRMLSAILVGSAASPLRKVLVDSGLGEDIAGGGVESDLRQMIFSIGLKGMDSTKAKRVETLILTTLEKLAKNTIDTNIIAAAMNTLEFQLREQNSGSFPRGLSLLYGILPSWLYGGDPINALAFDAPLQSLKTDLRDGKPVFEELIQTYLLDNQHRATVVMDPDAQWNSKREKAEAKKLKALPADGVLEQTKTLQKLQNTVDSTEALATLPRLAISDIATKNTPIPIEVHKEGNQEVLTHAIATNGIIYFDLAFDLKSVPQDLLVYIPLFTRCLLEMGTNTQSFDDFVHRQHRETGGVWTSLFSGSTVDGTGTIAKLLLRSKWLPHQMDKAMAIIIDALLHADLSNQSRFLQMVLEEKADYETSVLESGHHYAVSRIQKQLHESDWLDEHLSGVEQLFFIRKLHTLVQTQWDQVRQTLETLQTLLITSDNLIVNITADPKLLPKAQNAVKTLRASLPATSHAKHDWGYIPTAQNELLIVPTTVNYVAKGVNLYAHGIPAHGSNHVITRYLRSSWLWDEVRMKGGAYGAFSSFDSLSGSFTLASYRDPHLTETLSVFDATVQFLQNLHVSPEELNKAIIGQMSDFDRYMLPDSKGFASFSRHLIGMTEDRRQKLREEMLATTPADFVQFAKALEIVRDHGIVSVVTNSEGAKKIYPKKISALVLPVA